jgi:hypothetical protein
MRKFFPALIAGVALAMATHPASAGISIEMPCSATSDGTVDLSSGQEQSKSFICGSEYEFVFTIAPSTNEYLDMAFGGTSGDEYTAELKANPGGYDVTNTYDGGTSTQWNPELGPGTWNLYVTLSDVPVMADPFSGFEFSNTPLDLPFPTSATPLPSTWTVMLLGLIGLAAVAYGRKKTATPLAAA